ncbi:ATP synthase subunit delta, mitochondrial [Planococcus citri]|uniref:ATP synthase subunit delta, mitochondrial n=1 Tax=Planococcus citri TaxID=170843 RepID=UPI0031F8FBEF
MATVLRSQSSRLLSSLKRSNYLRNVLSRGYADDVKMDFTFSAANKVFYANQSVKQVDVPGFNCAFGILPNHVPTITILKPGVVTVYEEDGSAKKIFVSSGSVTVNEDSSVQILAEEAHPLDSFDKNNATEALHQAEKQLASASSEADKAEAQIAVEAGQAILAALNA